ncbi:MAG: hypothetical protein M3503_00620 [Actinomycetota bacterium]|nr:hypothetical protein [Actinomycetota bacterium]
MRGRGDGWSWAAVGIALVAAGVALTTHEMWRDEWQAWLLADSSRSLPDLLANVRHEGHSPLWHVLLFGLSRIGPVELMRVLVAAVAVASTAVVAWCGPFRSWQKPLFALGYFSAFEYLAVSRPYGLTALFLFTYAALTWSSERRHVAWRSILLVLLALTTVYGAMVALVLAGAAVLGRGRRPAGDLVPAGVAAVAVVASLVLARPRATTTGFYSSDRLLDPFLGVDPERLELRELVRALVPIPPLRSQGWWNDSLVDSPSGIVVGLFALVAVGIVTLAIRRSPVSLAMWAAGVGGFLLFGYVVYPGSIYHYGHVYLLAVAAIWLASSRGEVVDWRLVVALLGVQAVGGVAALALDATGPFSNGERLAAALDDAGVVVVDPDWFGTTIAGERGSSVFMAASGDQRTYVRWDDVRECLEQHAPLCLERAEVVARAEEAGGDVLVLPAHARLPASAPFRLVEVFDGAATDEDFALYRRTG